MSECARVSRSEGGARMRGGRRSRIPVALGVWMTSATLVSALCATRAEAQAPLRVCLEAGSPPFSSRVGLASAGTPKHGLDREVAAEVATALGRSLEVFWFEASREEEDLLAQQAGVLFAEERCELIAGYPLTRDGLRSAGRRLRPSRPYLALPLTLVVGEGTRALRRLDEVAGLRLAVERDSLASAIAAVYAGGRLQPGLVRFAFEGTADAETRERSDRASRPRALEGGHAIFEAIERGAAEVAFVEAHRFALYRVDRPETRLRSTGYRHGLAVNTGFVGISAALLDAVDRALARLIGSGRIAAIVTEYGLDYAAPVAPAILPPLTPRLLAQPQGVHSARSSTAIAFDGAVEVVHERER